MAIEFSQTIKGVQYEVRTAGRSIRLYTNGAFHSQYHPAYVFTGAVWDLLSLPSLALRESPQDVLVLGVAGGTVIHQLQKLHPPKQITGIELDATHIRLAKRHFHLRYDNLTLHCAEASAWLQETRRQYDVIIDDIFLHGEGDPERPFPPDADWFAGLHQHLKPGGTIIQNHIGAGLALKAAKQFKKGVILGFDTDGYDNLVLAWYDTDNAKQLTANLQERLDSLPRRESRRLRHRSRVIRG